MTELKPCPFCGHKITDRQPFWDDLGTDDDYYVIRCPLCMVLMYEETPELVIEKWNKRVKE